MSELGKPVRTWHEVWYADTTCIRYNITTNRYENGQEYDVVDAIKTVDTIPIEFIKAEADRFDYIGDNAIPSIQQAYFNRASYLRQLIETWQKHGNHLQEACINEAN